jgi:hypothetical protein
MKTTKLSKALERAIEEGWPLYWIAYRKELRLRAVTYWWENGRERTKKLASFEWSAMPRVLKIHFELCRRLDAREASNLAYTLDDAAWAGWTDGYLSAVPKELAEWREEYIRRGIA